MVTMGEKNCNLLNNNKVMVKIKILEKFFFPFVFGKRVNDELKFIRY